MDERNKSRMEKQKYLHMLEQQNHKLFFAKE